MKKYIFAILILLLISNLKGEEIKVFFSPEENLDETIVSEIGKAKKEIRGAFYEVREKTGEELIKAHRRGVDVKIIIEGKNAYIENSSYPKLENEGLAYRDRRSHILHDKFLIIDGKEAITGSYNPGSSKYQFNDLIMINSESLSENYLVEFSNLLTKSKMKNYKSKLNISGIKVENYFTPSKKPLLRIEKLLRNAKESIYFSQFSFTHKEIGKCILGKEKEGVDVKGIVDYYEGRSSLPFQLMKLLNLMVISDRNYADLWHAKFIIIDRKIVITGSPNLSYSAFKRNNENILIIHSKKIAEKYTREFLKYFNRWKYF